ncbi:MULTISPECIES: DUF456 domain-containing protein [Arthrobacter]|jgi:uncharacterized protein YqgC (DUF456 family)|uniref:DUF456 domain-containing protein n=1 Tax=Crystallibacter crystallopoietes TaxID=37928 RepID=A0A1H1DI99_9MICC|nr:MULTISPECIES: DUF456 domain-containing protein [Arthrobacter]AUI50307.1 hypothetical protein AC20117_05185 [Arthrobacter crystallopoietes]MCW2133765.1 hypothetical protein [Arthrobacter sp. VKM Ac-2550]SDQ75918.1 hypothetical protein SAMN04489742_2448 [Arthrobacter crystallopoietes]
MEAQIIVTLVCGLLIAVGVAGIIVPVLPGAITIGVSLLIWALVLQNTVGWVVFGLGAVLVVAGMLASAVLTGKRLKGRQIPNRSIVVGVVVGLVGMFVIPVVGLFVGFTVGLLLSEYLRQRELRPALHSSAVALKAMGIGILIELGCAFAAGSIWSIGVILHFFF